jgi:hypothetical protein
MDRVVASLLTFVLGFALWSAPSALLIARPAIWVATGPAGAVRLLATLHWLPKGKDWRSTQVNFALEVSDNASIQIEFTDGRKMAWKLGL